MNNRPAARFLAAAMAMAAAGFASSCSMGADPTELYQRGQKEAQAQHWELAVGNLEAFARKACSGSQPDKRCRKANLALGRGYEHRGSVARAWVAFDTALTLPPHDDDASARAELARLEQQLRDKQDGVAGRGPVMVRYRDEMTDEFTARAVLVSIDFNPVHARAKGATDLRSPEFVQLWAGSLPAGDHVLVVEAAHSCKPGVGTHCSGSQVHRSWSFTSEAHAPTGLDVRAFAESAAGNNPVRAGLEMKPH